MGKKANWAMICAVIGAAALGVAYLAAKASVDSWLAATWGVFVGSIALPVWSVVLVVIAFLAGSFVAGNRHRKLQTDLLALTDQLAEHSRLGEPDADGLYRRDGKPFCPECLRTKGVVYYLKNLRTSGGMVGTVDGPMTRLPDHHVHEWQCSVCESVYHEI